VSLVGESSVGASNRRVEALVGLDAFRELAAERAIVSQLTSSLKTPKDQLASKIAELSEPQVAEKRIAQFEAKASRGHPGLAGAASAVGPFRVVAETLGAAASDDARARLQVRANASALVRSSRSAPRWQGAVVIVATDDVARASRREGRRSRKAPARRSAVAAAGVTTSPRAVERTRGRWRMR
jgi:alanyl-tRNA synthetase